MAVYLYKAKDIINNKIIRGELELENEQLVKKFLSDKYFYPISIRKKNVLNSDLSEIGIFKTRVKMSDITFFCKQFAAMIQAGISIGRALEICIQQATNRSFKKNLINIHEEVNKGITLSEACKKEGIFPDILVSMIECGEVSGNLDVVLHQVVEHFDTQLGTARKLKKALTYPALTLMIVIAVVIIMMVKVIPAFVEMFESTGVELPLPTQIMMKVSHFMVANGWILGIMTVGLVIGIINIKKIETGRKFVDELSLKLPLFGDLNKKALSATFAKTLAMLVASGLPMLQAMEIVKKVMNHAVAWEEIDQAIEELKHGSTLHRALKGSRIYPAIMFSMIHVGEETGALDEMMVKIGNYFNEEVQTTIDSLMVLIEPALTVLIAFVVGGIMLAVILPTFTMATAMM
ncbi:hypothetical protein CS063_02330 [Sporanaerobium hydrogeniformans]|uniref:Uncharacterized protein n=1 Tax=Sporanaerobium hydrogeniformans TaxID=3072179 RepID=A0AC61DGC7_9FIRM|nr:type II secretion system F family protein [Sporanaerobium hydrogeniformans]PHV72334.1 hypothetical protein CS063_02330 [Sporanaerobium hydrogeniformans]